MPLPPEHYIARAFDMEAAAAQVADLTIKQNYLETAKQYRYLAQHAARTRESPTDLDSRPLST
jgi:hypothetical protein